MSDIALSIESLGKQYRIGSSQGEQMLREVLTDAGKLPFRLAKRILQGEINNQSKKPKLFWALQDISFEVKQGEILGIIGHNGAGKSTLLKILSRITEPTTGRAKIYGRVGSLLEVGTGFHWELSGRENIYLNGAILGMKKAEIDRKFDEIVAFSEVEEFLDTPVKRYSSGMYMRLAFAVAAHLEPEILLIDEVLAVGDAAFQKKCLGKMNDIAQAGRTVIFVSHTMGAIQALCSRAILLRNGQVFSDGAVMETVAAYLNLLEQKPEQDLLTRNDRYGSGDIKLAQVDITIPNHSDASVLITGQPARFAFLVTDASPGTHCSFTIYDQLGQPVTYFDTTIHSIYDVVEGGPDKIFTCELDELSLIPGRYRINAAITHNGELQDHLEAAAFFDVELGDLRGRLVPPDSGYGSIIIPHRWIKPD